MNDETKKSDAGAVDVVEVVCAACSGIMGSEVRHRSPCNGQPARMFQEGARDGAAARRALFDQRNEAEAQLEQIKKRFEALLAAVRGQFDAGAHCADMACWRGRHPCGNPGCTIARELRKAVAAASLEAT